MRLVGGIFALMMLVACPSGALAINCMPAADDAANAVKDWRTLHAAFAAWQDCDDGVIAEGFSDRVATLLADDWPRVTEFGRLASTDSAFRKFVLNHVDELMTPDQAHAIERHARKECPSGMSTLCIAIARRVHAAMQP
jgi:hypothetical protein